MTVIVPKHTRVFVALHGGCVVICSILFLLLWDCIDLRHKRVASKRIKWYSIIAIMMYTISSALILAYFILYEEHLLSMAGFSDHLLQTAYNTFWRLAQAFLYLLLLQRLKHSFKHTKYSSSATTYCMFDIGISIFLITFAIKSCIYVYLYRSPQHDEQSDSLYAIVGNIDMGITQIIDLALSVGIIGLFLNKLYKLNVDLTDTDFLNASQAHIIMIAPINHEQRAYCDQQEEQQQQQQQQQQRRKLTLNERQKSVVGIMAKLTLLSGIALASSQITLFLGGLLYLSELIPAYHEYIDILYSLQMAYLAMNAVIISSSIALSFDFTYSHYKRFCNRIDRVCVSCCTWRTKKKISKLSTSSIDRSALSPLAALDH